jgi:hypothetical protein
MRIHRTDSIFEPMLQSIPDPFDSYGPLKSEGEIYSVLQPLSILTDSSPSLPHTPQDLSHAQSAFAWAGVGDTTSPDGARPDPLLAHPSNPNGPASDKDLRPTDVAQNVEGLQAALVKSGLTRSTSFDGESRHKHLFYFSAPLMVFTTRIWSSR